MKNRLGFISLFFLWFIPALIFFFALRNDWRTVWQSVGVGSFNPPFIDLQLLPAGVQTVQHGGDPLVANPYDVFKRPVNYPRVWIYACSFLHITSQNVIVVGLMFCAIFLVCISMLIFRAKSGWEQLALLLAGLSLAPLFAFERGNIDLVIFSIVFLGCVLPKETYRAWLFLIATVLKLYPLAAMAAIAVRQQGRKRIVPVALLAFAAILLALQWRDLDLIRKTTPVSAFASFGVLSLGQSLLFSLSAHVAGATLFTCRLAAGAVVAACRIALLWMAVQVWRRPSTFDRSVLQSRAGDLFFVFGAIYVASYAVGSNWNYRLIFLIPTLPFAFELTRNPNHWRLGLRYILCVLLAENLMEWSNQGYKTPFAHLSTLVLYLSIIPILAEQAKSYGEQKIPLHQSLSFSLSR